MRAHIVPGDAQEVRRLLRLRKDAEEDGAYRVAKRIHAIMLSIEGRTAPDIASVLKVHRSNVSVWLRNWMEYGFDGLLEGHRTGRPSGLPANQRKELADIIDSGPVAYGFETGVWTSPMIAEVIRCEYGLRYHPGHVRKILKEMNFSVQRPRRMLAKADRDKQYRWERYTYPNLKKKRSATKRH